MHEKVCFVLTEYYTLDSKLRNNLSWLKKHFMITKSIAISKDLQSS